MPRLKPLNAATCTNCAGKKTRRAGYDEARKRSVWYCDTCKKPFTVRMLVLQRT